MWNIIVIVVWILELESKMCLVSHQIEFVQFKYISLKASLRYPDHGCRGDIKKACTKKM